MPKTFQKIVEDFVCGNCGTKVKGSGYTNHCPVCLWSKHVDNSPGDRASTCQGLMQPVAVRVTRDGYDLLHRCVVCKYEKWNMTSSEDHFELILKLSVAKLP